MTQHFPSQEIEFIKRTIVINQETINVKSETIGGKSIIQVFSILEYSQKDNEDYGISDFFVCSSKDGFYITYFVIPLMEEIEFIEVVQPAQWNFQGRRYRFLVD